MDKNEIEHQNKNSIRNIPSQNFHESSQRRHESSQTNSNYDESRNKNAEEIMVEDQTMYHRGMIPAPLLSRFTYKWFLTASAANVVQVTAFRKEK